jgi:hypothetical protein
MPSRKRSVLREEALAAWRFQPSDTTKDLPARHGNRNEDLPGLPAWISQASRRDTEIITTALMRELNSRPDEGKTSAEVSDSMAAQFEALGTRTEALSRSCNNQGSIPALNNFIGKRRSRRGNRAPITIMRADPADFQAMVQQMTAFPLENNSRAAPSLLKPQPERPGLDFTDSD